MAPSTGSLEKAYLALVAPPEPANKPPKLSAVMGKAGGEGEVVFTFNPKEFTITKTAKWKRQGNVGAARAAMPEFEGSQPATMSVEVFFDASEADSPTVAADVQRLIDTVVPLSKTRTSGTPSPPWVVFGWGSFISFVAIVKKVAAKYTMFKPDGTPIRATCTLDLEEIPTDPPPRQNPTSGAPASHRVHRVVEGDSLPSIAEAEYGDPTLWRGLAAVNHIDDPLRLPPGSPITVPTAGQLPELTEVVR